MKFLYRGKVRARLAELISNSEIPNHSNAYLRSILPSKAGTLLPSKAGTLDVDFHFLVGNQYWECLEDNIDYLYKHAKFDELQAVVFIITKVFEYQSLNPNTHQKLRAFGEIGKLISDASKQLFYMAYIFVEEEPSRFEPAFNMPDPSVLEKFSGEEELAVLLFNIKPEETISEQEEIAETTIDDSDSSFEEHNQRMKEQNEAIYGSEKVSHNKKEPIITWEKNTKKDSGSKLDNALAYFFEFAFFCLDKIKNNQSLSETDKYIFRKEYLQVKGLEDYGVMFFSRIEIESLSFANYHFEKNMEFKIKDAWANREKNLSDPLITEVRNHLANILKI